MQQLQSNLKKIRMTKRLNQEEFGKKFGITRSTIGAYEEGRAEPKLSFVYKIAKEYNIDIMRLLEAELSVNEISGFKPDRAIAKEDQDLRNEMNKLAFRISALEKKLNG